MFRSLLYINLEYNCTDAVCTQIIIIRFNSVLVYLPGDSTALRRFKNSALINRYKTHKPTYQNNKETTRKTN